MQAFRDRYVEQLGLGMLAARFSEITQKPNPPFAFASASRGSFVGPADAFSLFGGVKEGAIVSGFEAALTEVERARRYGFTAGELKRELADQEAGQERLYNDRDKQPSSAPAPPSCCATSSTARRCSAPRGSITPTSGSTRPSPWPRSTPPPRSCSRRGAR